MTAFVESPYSKNLPNRFPPKQKPLVGPTGRSSPSWPRLHATEPRAVEFAVVVAHGVRHTVFVGNPARKREQIVLKLAPHPSLIVHRRSVGLLVGWPPRLRNIPFIGSYIARQTGYDAFAAANVLAFPYFFFLVCWRLPNRVDLRGEAKPKINSGLN